MDAAVNLFDENVQYDDTAFPQPFVGRDALNNHLKICESAFPLTFTFETDKVADDVGGAGSSSSTVVQWHVENNGEPLPFTRGTSY